MADMDALLRMLLKKYKRFTDREMEIIADVYEVMTGDVPRITDHQLLPDQGKLFDECDDVLKDIPFDAEMEAENRREWEKLVKEKQKRSN
jgi:hypothetical protein